MSQREPYVQRPCGRRAFPFMMVRGGSSNWSTCVKENREVARGHPGGATKYMGLQNHGNWGTCM